jgi:hypothetical protein
VFSLNRFYLPKTLAGKNSSARKNAKTASQVMPIKRKGKDSNQITGQRISASKARGQHNTHNNNQQINVSINYLLSKK